VIRGNRNSQACLYGRCRLQEHLELLANESRGSRDQPEGTTLMPPKISEIIKLIEADGWYLVATKGSHRQYKHPSKPGRVTVAGKPSDTLHPRTERSILRQAQIEWRPR
jgi:predicted RNA binding protein YcfA (HicA-like mRNA interferase family)